MLLHLNHILSNRIKHTRATSWVICTVYLSLCEFLTRRSYATYASRVESHLIYNRGVTQQDGSNYSTLKYGINILHLLSMVVLAWRTRRNPIVCCSKCPYTTQHTTWCRSWAEAHVLRALWFRSDGLEIKCRRRTFNWVNTQHTREPFTHLSFIFTCEKLSKSAMHVTPLASCSSVCRALSVAHIVLHLYFSFKCAKGIC